jgi:hypothetical protein
VQIAGQYERESRENSKIGHPTLASSDCLILESSIKHRGQISSCDGQALRLSTPLVMELELCNPCAWYGKTSLDFVERHSCPQHQSVLTGLQTDRHPSLNRRPRQWCRNAPTHQATARICQNNSPGQREGLGRVARNARVVS